MARKAVAGKTAKFMTLGFLLTTIAPGVVMLPIPQVIAQTSPAAQKTGTNTLRASETEQLFQQGIQYLNRKQYNDALQSLQSVLEFYQAHNDRAKQIEVLRYLGLAYQQLEQYYRALQNLQQSRMLAQEIGDRQGEVNALIASADVHRVIKETDVAIAIYEEARAITIAIQNPQLEALVIENLRHFYSGPSDLRAAIDLWQKNLVFYREKGSKIGESLSLVALSLLYYDLKNNQKSVEYHRQNLFVVAEAKKQNSQNASSKKIETLQDVYTTSLLENGIDRFCTEKASEIEQNLHNVEKPENKALLLGILSHCYEKNNQSQQAISYKQQSLLIAQQNKLRIHEGLILVDLGKSYQVQGNFAAARKSVEQGLAILLEVSTPQWQVLALNMLSQVYAALAEHHLAIETGTEALTLAQRYSVPWSKPVFKIAVIQDIKKLNDEQHKKQQSRKELTWYQEKLQAIGFDIGQLNLSEANIGSFSGRIRDALINLGDVYYQTQDYSRASAFYQSVMIRQANQGDAYGSMDVDILSRLGKTFAKLGKLAESESMLRLALQYDEMFRTSNYSQKSSKSEVQRDSEQRFFAERKASNFQQLQQVLVRQNRSDTALLVAEEARARTFAELLSARNDGKPIPDGTKLPSPLSLEEIRQIAKTQNATLVQYSIVGDNLLYIWVIKPTGDITFRSTKLDPAQPLTQLVSNSRSNRGARGRAGIKISQQPVSPTKTDSLAQLYQYLIAPIAQDLPTDPKQRVIFLPQGELFLVPFAALPDAQNRPLIERHPLSTAPSIQTLALTQTLANRPKASGNAVIVGDPTMPTYQGELLQPLPAARQEAIAIGQQLNTTPLIGAQATKATVLQQIPTAKLLHFATHGLLDPIKGNIPGAIALAPDGQDNGFLSAAEIFNLQLNADLVVLSACDTGQGDITGDGVIGLSRSFIAAGAPSIIVSLWAVNDQSTSDLMQEFYRQLKQQPDKAQALRQAMLITKQRYPDPSHWAAFTLVGEAQ